MLAHKFVIKVLASILSSIFMFMSLLVMTRYVGYEYGIMMWGWSMVGLINTISDLGFDTATVKFISEGKDQNNCISTHLFLKAILICIIILMTIAYIIISIINGSIDNERIMIILIFLIYYIISDITWVLIRTFDGRLEAANSSLVQATDATVRSLILIILAFFGASAVVLSMSYVFGIIFSLCVAICLFRKIKYKITRPSLLGDYIVFAKPIAIGLILITAISFIDKVVIEFFWGTEELGYYTATIGVVYAATAIGVALNYVLLPKFSELFAAGNRNYAEAVLWKSEKYISILFLPAVIFMMVFGNSIAIVLFGADFAPAGKLVSILSLYIYLSLMLGILTQVLYSTNKNKLYRNSTIIYTISTILMLFVLIPEEIGGIRLAGLGAEGAALAITIGYLIFTVLTCYYVKVSSGMSLHKGLFRQFLAGAVVFAITFLIRGDGTIGPIGLILLFVLCFMIFGVALFLLREMNKDDLIFIVNSMNPKKIYDDSKNEKT